MKRLLVILVTTWAAAILMGGCIRDNTDHCNNVIVNFSYTADDGQEHLTEYIGSIDLYVFDEEGTHIMTVGYGGTDLHSSGGSAFFRLQEGRYALYAVGNPLEKTLVFGLNTGDPERMFIASPESARGGTVHGQDHNYLGSASLEISDSRYTSRSTVRMYSAHIDVSVEVTGLHARLGTRAAGDYTLSISESNSKVDFNNRVAYGELHECYPEMEYDAETGKWLSRNLALFRMDNGEDIEEALCNHVLKMTDGDGNVVIEKSILEYLAENAGKIDLTRQEALLPIEVNFSEVAVTVTPPQWYLEDVTTEWE